MAATRAFTLASCVFLGLLTAAVLDVPVRAEEEASGADAVAVICEAWRVEEPDRIAEIEAITERDPGAAGAVRRALRDGSAQRVARILAPAALGEVLQFSDMREIAQVFTKTTTQGSTTMGVQGFHEIGTRLQLKPWNRGAGQVSLEIDLRMTAPGPAADTDPARSRTSTQVQTTLRAPLGAWRMFLSRAGDAGVVVVLVRASALGEQTTHAEAPASGDVGNGFSEVEIERFAAIQRVVDERERARRGREMAERQLERLDVELTDEQREAVVAMTVAYRERLRERMRSMPRDDRETMQASMDALRQDYADALATVLDAATVEQVLEGLGRARVGGFGRSR